MASLFQGPRTTMLILASFWAAILLSLPAWWTLTSIERLRLPRSRVDAWQVKMPCPIRPTVSLSVVLPQTLAPSSFPASLPSLADAAPAEQHSSSDDWLAMLERTLQGDIDRLGACERVLVRARWHGQPAPVRQRQVAEGTQESTQQEEEEEELGIAYEVSLLPDAPLAVAPPVTPSHRAMPLAGALATEIARLFQLGSHAAAPTTAAREIPYARRVRTVWHLLNEDASQQGWPSAIDGWSSSALDAALERHVGPLASALGQAHAIARESSSQWWAPLAFQPREVQLEAPAEAVQAVTPSLDTAMSSETSSVEDVALEPEEKREEDEVEAIVDQPDEKAVAPEPISEPVVPVVKEYHITQEDLQIFVNGAEWSMASPSPAGPSDFPDAPWHIQSSPEGASHVAWGEEALDTERTLHFCLFVPSPAHRPMRIQDEQSLSIANVNASQATGWLVPQWGGVVIYNPSQSNETLAPPLSVEELDVPMRLFASQLRALLGVRLPVSPPGSTSAQRAARRSVALDALLRRRLLETSREAVDTLTGIIRLVDKIQNLGVGKQVRDDVIDALDNLESLRAHLSAAPLSPYQPGESSALLQQALQLSARAAAAASRAFFNRNMLGLLYFPSEHVYAVYTPLFGPLAVPLIVALLREIKLRRKARTSKTLDSDKRE